MKETNLGEMQLRSWPLRRPSAKVKRRIFAQPHPVNTAEAACLQQDDSPPFRLAWLVPATMALVVICLLFNQHNNPFPASSRSTTMIAVALSNQGAASWLPGSFARDQNSIPLATFEWTNGARTNPGTLVE